MPVELSHLLVRSSSGLLTQGIKVLGTPLGHPDFVAAHLDRVLSDCRTLLERISAVQDVQCAWALLLHSAVGRANCQGSHGGGAFAMGHVGDAWVMADFGQTDLGQTDFGQTDFDQTDSDLWCCVLCVVCCCCGGGGGGAVWRGCWFHGFGHVWCPPNRPSQDRPSRDRPSPGPPKISLFFSLFGSSRGILVVVLKAGTLKCTRLGSRAVV